MAQGTHVNMRHVRYGFKKDVRLDSSLVPNMFLASEDIKQKQNDSSRSEPVWPSGKALGW